MSPTEIKNSIKAFLVENFIYDENYVLGDDASLMEEGIIDSTGVLELIMFLETKFTISVKDDELVPENLDSVNNLIGYLSRKLDIGLKAAS